MQLAVGDSLDNRYVIDRPIARGGMATVYRCVDTRLGREVAAKVMHEQFVHDPVFRDRFRREARAMAQLSHPNLVNVYDFSAQGNAIFLIMELITGGTLRELLDERGPMPPHAAASVMRGMLTGLAAAHARGLIHRDIKPDNVLINADHRVKLADFGLVRAAAEATHSTDQIVGTVSYLSPEQVDGSPMTHASDVYSAGIVLFELLTGRTPFAGDTPIAHAYARLRGDVPPPSAFIAGVPKLFDELVATATARAPEDRFRDATEFLHALDDVAEALRLPAYTVPVPTNSAATRAAAHPTNVDMRPSPAPEEGPQRAPAAANVAETRVATPRASEERLFPEGQAQMPAQAPPAYHAPAQQMPPAQPPAQPQKPRINPVTNRGGVGLAVFVVLAFAVIAAVAIGGWWFGSGNYGQVPPLIAV
ncbi:Serine/threonine-protein kinase PknL [Corynebacterium glaucum]|uniref:non-specific serine/threonine protein kinase n=1 Tax=Corynebacterium glaucum TaxID=187491 RepID=A0A1Q2HXS0_9CORY|nr:protein kinase [Corynebacterium glaucum]AQQ15648.1 Serine/threonine-protein kinase PknL [Corynebacterium glaucum]WJZ08152.1 Serine/threonine-protein kinase PknL [Corynebacterium glaucum]